MELKYGCYSWALHGGACQPKNFIILIKTKPQYVFVNKLGGYIQLLKENVIETVVLE